MAKKRHSQHSSASTPATKALQQQGVPFQIYEYEHDAETMDAGYGIEAAVKLGFSQDQVFKTLMVDTGSGLAVGVVPVAGTMDLKSLAQTLGVKKVAMATPQQAEKATGYIVGGISPIGQKTRQTTVLDASALQFEEILVSGGKRGFDIGINPHDLQQVTDAVIADIAKHSA